MEQEVHQIILMKLARLEDKLDSIHKPGECEPVKVLQKQISYWAGGLATLVFLLGIFVLFKS